MFACCFSAKPAMDEDVLVQPPASTPKPALLSQPVHDKAYLREHYERCEVRSWPGAGAKDAKGRYTLGRGRHGTVKLAFSKALNTYVAVKGEANSLIGQVRAPAERDLLAALKLPHVVRLLDYADSPKKHYTVMELGRPIPLVGITLEKACYVMSEVIRGLDELHAADVYHRDIHKLDNVLMVEERVDGQMREVVKITDLGKAACRPSSAMRATYEFSDAEKACELFAKLLWQCAPEDVQAFVAWYRGVPDLRLHHLKSHPLLAAYFNVKAELTGTTAMSRLTFSARTSWEWITAYVPLAGGRRLPDPVCMEEAAKAGMTNPWAIPGVGVGISVGTGRCIAVNGVTGGSSD